MTEPVRPSIDPRLAMATLDRFLTSRTVGGLTADERGALMAGFDDERIISPRQTIVEAGRTLTCSTLLVEGMLCRYVTDRKGLRQLVALHLPGEFVDLHGYPLQILDHSVTALTSARIVTMPHNHLDLILADRLALTKKLWFCTMLDAAMHRAWTFRLGRLDAVGRLAHFVCETHARLNAMALTDGPHHQLGIRQSDLAEICGLTSVHVNRVLRQLREAGLCLYDGQTVTILNANGLARRGDFQPDYLYLRSSD